MGEGNDTRLSEMVARHKGALLKEWLNTQKESDNLRLDLISEGELHSQSEEFLDKLAQAMRSSMEDFHTESWGELWNFLARISRSRARQGFNPSETSAYIFSLKQPLFSLLKQEVGDAPEDLMNEVWTLNILMDKLGLYTYEEYQKGREEIINRQQQEMLELSTPVVKIWEGILVVPLIGTMDSERTQKVMENLLQSIVDTGSQIAIVDITGVPTVDTLVAQHLLTMVNAATLMGAQCIICGVRPQIAQTMVQLGIAFEGISTKATLADALTHAFNHLDLQVVSRKSSS